MSQVVVFTQRRQMETCLGSFSCFFITGLRKPHWTQNCKRKLPRRSILVYATDDPRCLQSRASFLMECFLLLYAGFHIVEKKASISILCTIHHFFVGPAVFIMTSSIHDNLVTVQAIVKDIPPAYITQWPHDRRVINIDCILFFEAQRSQ